MHARSVDVQVRRVERASEEIAGFSVPQVLFVIIKPTPLPLYLY